MSASRRFAKIIAALGGRDLASNLNKSNALHTLLIKYVSAGNKLDSDTAYLLNQTKSVDFKDLFTSIYLTALPLRDATYYDSLSLPNIVDYMMEAYHLNTPALNQYTLSKKNQLLIKLKEEEKRNEEELQAVKEYEQKEHKIAEEKKQAAKTLAENKIEREEMSDHSSKAGQLSYAVLSSVMFPYMDRSKINVLLSYKGLRSESRGIVVLDDIIKLHTILSSLSVHDNFKIKGIEECDRLLQIHLKDLKPEDLNRDFHKLFVSVKNDLLNLINPSGDFFDDLLSFLFLDQDKTAIEKMLQDFAINKKFEQIGKILLLENAYNVFGGPENMLKNMLSDYRDHARENNYYYPNKFIIDMFKKLKPGKLIEVYSEMREFIEKNKGVLNKIYHKDQIWTLEKILNIFQDPKTKSVYEFYQNQLDQKGNASSHESEEDDELIQDTMDAFNQTEMTEEDQEWGNDADTSSSTADWDEAEMDDTWKEDNSENLLDDDLQANNQVKKPGK